MWLPCNFGEKVIAREFSSSEYSDYYFVGLTKGCFNRIDYIFTKDIHNVRLDLQLQDIDKISYMPYDVHNDTFLKQASLNPIEVDLKLDINRGCVYKDYFDTKSGKSGNLMTIMLKEDGFHYNFLEHNMTPVTFISEKLLVKEVELKEREEGQMSLF